MGCWWPCCHVTHRLLDAAGTVLFNRDHGDTVRAVACGPLAAYYYIAGDRVNSVATTRQLDPSGSVNWSADHGDTVWSCDVDPGGKLHTAGTLTSGATHRRYLVDGTLDLSVNAAPFDAGVAIAPDARFWAFKTVVGGTDPAPLSTVFQYDFSDSPIQSLHTLQASIDHDDAGSAFVWNSETDMGTIKKFTAGVLDWTATSSAIGLRDNGPLCVDRQTGESYICGFNDGGRSNAYVTKFSAAGAENWTVEISEAFGGLVRSPRPIAAGGSKVFVGSARNSDSLATRMIQRISSGGGAYTIVYDPGLAGVIHALEIDSTDPSFLYVVEGGAGGFGQHQVAKYDANASPLTAVWTYDSDVTGVHPNRISAHGGLLGIAGFGSAETLVLLDDTGAVLWSKNEGNTADVAVTNSYVITIGNPSSAARCGLIQIYDLDGNLLFVKYPKLYSLGVPIFPSISATDAEIIASLRGTSGAKIFRDDGTLIDYFGLVVTAVDFDLSGFTFLATSSDVRKFATDTFICEWKAPFGSVDLAIASTGKVLTGAGSTLRQLTSAGASEWTAAVGGTVAQVAYDSSDNAHVAHARSSNLTHRKYNSSGTQQWSKDHGADLNAIRIDSSDHPFIGGDRVAE